MPTAGCVCRKYPRTDLWRIRGCSGWENTMCFPELLEQATTRLGIGLSCEVVNRKEKSSNRVMLRNHQLDSKRPMHVGFVDRDVNALQAELLG